MTNTSRPRIPPQTSAYLCPFDFIPASSPPSMLPSARLPDVDTPSDYSERLHSVLQRSICRTRLVPSRHMWVRIVASTLEDSLVPKTAY